MITLTVLRLVAIILDRLKGLSLAKIMIILEKVPLLWYTAYEEIRPLKRSSGEDQ